MCCCINVYEVSRCKGKAEALPYGVRDGNGLVQKKRGDRFGPSPRFMKGYPLRLPLKVHCLRKDLVGGGDDLCVELEAPLRGDQRGQFRCHVHIGAF